MIVSSGASASRPTRRPLKPETRCHTRRTTVQFYQDGNTDAQTEHGSTGTEKGDEVDVRCRGRGRPSAPGLRRLALRQQANGYDQADEDRGHNCPELTADMVQIAGPEALIDGLTEEARNRSGEQGENMCDGQEADGKQHGACCDAGEKISEVIEARPRGGNSNSVGDLDQGSGSGLPHHRDQGAKDDSLDESP